MAHDQTSRPSDKLTLLSVNAVILGIAPSLPQEHAPPPIFLVTLLLVLPQLFSPEWRRVPELMDTWESNLPLAFMCLLCQPFLPLAAQV